MLKGAFSFRGRIGRLNYFLGCLLLVLAVVLAVIGAGVLIAMARHSAANLALVAIFGLLVLVVSLWYSLSLYVRRIRDIGWDPFVVIVGWIAFQVFDALLAAMVPALTLGRSHTAIGVVVNLALSLALLFWPGRDPDDAAPRAPRLGAPDAHPAGTQPMPAALIRTGARTEFGRRTAR